MIKAVLFDLDGTLVNSLEDLAASTNYALEKFGFSTYEAEKYKYFVGDGLLKATADALRCESGTMLIKPLLMTVFLSF